MQPNHDLAEHYDLSRVQLPRLPTDQKITIPSHVYQTNCLWLAAKAIMTPDYNAALVSGFRTLPKELIDLLSSNQVSLEVPFDRLDQITASVSTSAAPLDHREKAIVHRGIAELAQEIGELVSAIGEVSIPVGIRLSNGRQGPFHFHDDRGTVVALRTYSGPATEFIDGKDVYPGKDFRIFSRPGAETHTPKIDEALLFRGGELIDGYTEGLVHRAPMNGGAGRILVAVFGRTDTTKFTGIRH